MNTVLAVNTTNVKETLTAVTSQSHGIWLLRKACIAKLLPILLLTIAFAAQAQFTYITNNGTITITGYTGPGGAVTIPSVINSLPVTDIGQNAFANSAIT